MDHHVYLWAKRAIVDVIVQFVHYRKWHKLRLERFFFECSPVDLFFNVIWNVMIFNILGIAVKFSTTFLLDYKF